MTSAITGEMSTLEPRSTAITGFVPPTLCSHDASLHSTTSRTRAASWQRGTTLHACKPVSAQARRRRCRPVSAALGQNDASIYNGPSPDHPTEPLAATSPTTVKKELVDILDAVINDDAQLKKIQQSILYLEGMNTVPLTAEFTEMALAGEWALRFSSTKPRVVEDTTARIRSLSQVFQPGDHSVTNRVVWSFPAKDGTERIMAELNVVCKYAFAGPSSTEVQLAQHKVSILDREDGRPNNMPDDMQAVIQELRRALPFEVFDPSGTSHISYIDPDFRVAVFSDERFAGVRNIFARVRP